MPVATEINTISLDPTKPLEVQGAAERVFGLQNSPQASLLKSHDEKLNALSSQVEQLERHILTLQSSSEKAALRLQSRETSWNEFYKFAIETNEKLATLERNIETLMASYNSIGGNLYALNSQRQENQKSDDQDLRREESGASLSSDDQRGQAEGSRPELAEKAKDFPRQEAKDEKFERLGLNILQFAEAFHEGIKQLIQIARDQNN